MISLSLAQKLKKAGLVWHANNNDFFAIPDRGMDDRVFVLSDMMSYLDVFRGWPVVTFHGSSEWALDYILTTEVVWLPTETQLRETLIDKLEQKTVTLLYEDGTYTCLVNLAGQELQFPSSLASDAYGLALLYLLEQVNN